MGKLDEVKEKLNTLRVALSLAFGILIFVVGAVIKRYDNNTVDLIYWIGFGTVFVIFVAIIFIVKAISNKTKEIGEL